MTNEWRSASYLHVPDIKEAAEYYEKKLGFNYSQFWGDPPNFVMMNRNNVTIMLAEIGMAKQYPELLTPNRKVDHHAWDVYIWIGRQSVEELYQELTEQGATIIHKPVKKEYYGMYELEVGDPWGHVLCFAEDIGE